MANPEHVKIIKQGVEFWNRWRKENPDVIPDLHLTDLKRKEGRCKEKRKCYAVFGICQWTYGNPG